MRLSNAHCLGSIVSLAIAACGASHGPPSPKGEVGDAAADRGPPCGYQSRGERVQIGTDIELCLPPVVCTPSETCPRGLGDCVNGKCIFKPGYRGLATLAEAWTTQYCDLKTGGCNGSVQDPLPYDVARQIARDFGPVCAEGDTTGTCVGIAAPPPLLAGNSQVAQDPLTGATVASWGLGMTAASGVCYELTGDGGTAVVAITDRCGGYCKCGASAFNECGTCINAGDTATQCPCVGAAPPVHATCCGRTCASAGGQCDWCANNNHPHFDLDDATFAHVCGPEGPRLGSCKLKKVKLIENCYPARPTWPK